MYPTGQINIVFLHKFSADMIFIFTSEADYRAAYATIQQLGGFDYTLIHCNSSVTFLSIVISSVILFGVLSCAVLCMHTS